MGHHFKKFFCLLLLVSACGIAAAQQLRVVIAGLSHDHVHGILKQFNDGKIIVVGIAEPDKQLQLKYGNLYHLPDSLFGDDLKKLLLTKKPDAVLGYNPVGEHVLPLSACMRTAGRSCHGGKTVGGHFITGKGNGNAGKKVSYSIAHEL